VYIIFLSSGTPEHNPINPWKEVIFMDNVATETPTATTTTSDLRINAEEREEAEKETREWEEGY
jgi:hypothetical protein